MTLIGNGDQNQTPVYFDMPRNTAVEKRRAQSVLIKTMGVEIEKQSCTIMIAVTAELMNRNSFLLLFSRGRLFPKDLNAKDGWIRHY